MATYNPAVGDLVEIAPGILGIHGLFVVRGLVTGGFLVSAVGDPNPSQQIHVQAADVINAWTAQGNPLVASSGTFISGGPYAAFLADGVTPTPAGVTYGKTYDYGGAVFNVKAAGAVGGFANDTVAIDRAITAAGATGTVFFPPDTYGHNENLVPPTGQTWVGPGAIVKLNNGRNGGLLVIPAQYANITIDGLTFDGNRTGATGGDVLTVLNTTVNSTTDLVFRACRFKSGGQNGTNVAGQRILFDRCIFDDNTVNGCLLTYGYGLSSDTASGRLTKTVRFIGCIARLNSSVGSHGFAVTGPGKVAWGTLIQDVSFVGCQSELNGTNGSAGGGGYRITSGALVGSEITPNTNPAGVKNVTLSACTSFACSDDGLWIQGSRNVTVVGMTVDGNQGGTGINQTGYGIEIQGAGYCTLVGCVILKTGSAGIQLSGGDAVNFSTSSPRNTVDGCVLDQCGIKAAAANDQGLNISQSNDTYPLFGTKVVGTTITASGLSGVGVFTAQDWSIVACYIQDSSLVSGTSAAITLFGTVARQQVKGRILNNVLTDTRAGGARTQNWGIQDNSVNTDGCLIVGNDCTNNIAGSVSLVGIVHEIRSNPGYNPVGNSPNGVPATGVAAATASYDRWVYLTAGTSAVTMTVAGNSGGASVIVIPANTLSPVFVPASKVWTPTYAGGVPTAVVYGV